MHIAPKSVGKITLLTPNGEEPVSYKQSLGNGIVINIPVNLPFSSLSVLKIEKTGIIKSKLKITD